MSAPDVRDDAFATAGVSALAVDGLSVLGSTAIGEFVEDRWPDPAPPPADPLEHARAA